MRMCKGTCVKLLKHEGQINGFKMWLCASYETKHIFIKIKTYI